MLLKVAVSASVVVAALAAPAAMAGGLDEIFIDSFESAVVDPPPPPPPPDDVAACAAIRAEHNFERITGTVVYTTGGATVIRNLATLRGLYSQLGNQPIDTSLYVLPLSKGEYYAMAFTGQALQNDFNSSGYSPGGQQQGDVEMAQYAYMTISRCAGDFRLRSNIGNNDPYMACSSDVNIGLTDNMVNFGVGNVQSTNQFLGNVCTLDKTVTYFLNLVYADPRPSSPGQPGLLPNEFACNLDECAMKYGTQ